MTTCDKVSIFCIDISYIEWRDQPHCYNLCFTDICWRVYKTWNHETPLVSSTQLNQVTFPWCWFVIKNNIDATTWLIIRRQFSAMCTSHETNKAWQSFRVIKSRNFSRSRFQKAVIKREPGPGLVHRLTFRVCAGNVPRFHYSPFVSGMIRSSAVIGIAWEFSRNRKSCYAKWNEWYFRMTLGC